MKKEIAIELMEEIKDFYSLMGAMAETIEKIDDDTELKKVRGRFAKIMEATYDLMFPVIKEYPELDLDKKELISR